VPDYTTAPRPLLPAGWKTWSLWQYTSIGTVPGIQDPGHTDLDRANPATPPVLGNQQQAGGDPVGLDYSIWSGLGSFAGWDHR
jgi:hypothetical protein